MLRRRPSSPQPRRPRSRWTPREATASSLEPRPRRILPGSARLLTPLHGAPHTRGAAPLPHARCLSVGLSLTSDGLCLTPLPCLLIRALLPTVSCPLYHSSVPDRRDARDTPALSSSCMETRGRHDRKKEGGSGSASASYPKPRRTQNLALQRTIEKKRSAPRPYLKEET